MFCYWLNFGTNLFNPLKPAIYLNIRRTPKSYSSFSIFLAPALASFRIWSTSTSCLPPRVSTGRGMEATAALSQACR